MMHGPDAGALYEILCEVPGVTQPVGNVVVTVPQVAVAVSTLMLSFSGSVSLLSTSILLPVELAVTVVDSPVTTSALDTRTRTVTD